jgi:hypothetical protein
MTTGSARSRLHLLENQARLTQEQIVTILQFVAIYSILLVSIGVPVSDLTSVATAHVE